MTRNSVIINFSAPLTSLITIIIKKKERKSARVLFDLSRGKVGDLGEGTKQSINLDLLRTQREQKGGHD